MGKNNTKEVTKSEGSDTLVDLQRKGLSKKAITFHNMEVHRQAAL